MSKCFRCLQNYVAKWHLKSSVQKKNQRLCSNIKSETWVQSKSLYFISYGDHSMLFGDQTLKVCKTFSYNQFHEVSDFFYCSVYNFSSPSSIYWVITMLTEKRKSMTYPSCECRHPRTPCTPLCIIAVTVVPCHPTIQSLRGSILTI